MIEVDSQKLTLLENLGQGLRAVSREVAVTEKQTDYRPEYLSVGELSEIHLHPKKAQEIREEEYYKSYKRVRVPSSEDIEVGIKTRFAEERTLRQESYKL